MKASIVASVAMLPLTMVMASAQTTPVPADVAFMQGMIVHHAQALAMIRLVPGRAQSEAIQLLARRMEASQASESALMLKWLQVRSRPAADSTHQHTHMPGMLSPEAVDSLAKVTGSEFDRLFLQLMIRHHEGALTMVEQLFSNKGAGEDAELFQLASHIDADQRAEIARMRRMLLIGTKEK
ncbi:MAG: DUF305 domain-containing protein [Gemmatimonadota bacterium]